MSTRFVNIDRNTPMLLPPDLREWVQNDDLVHFVVEALALLDVSSANVNHRGTGSEQYPPGMMLGLLIYSYAQGLFSSRQIERATYQNLSVRYLAANTHPDHDTIAKFRRDNGELIRSAFVQLLQLAQAAGLVRLGAIALDGTKIGAATNKRPNLTYAEVQAQLGQLGAQVAALLERAEAADQRGEPEGQLPAELAEVEQRRARLLAAKAQLEQQALVRHQQREDERDQAPPGAKRSRLGPQPKARDRINLTDGESTLTPTRNGFIQGYNAQLAVSTDSGLIVAADVVRDTSDIKQLQPMIRQVLANVGVPTHVLADTGYENVLQIQAVEAASPTIVLCPPARSGNANPATRSKRRWRERSKVLREQMCQRLLTPAGKALYGLRKTTVEPAIGIIKAALGFRNFRLRGLAKVRTEWTLVSLALNCRRLALRWN
jgi:transposase